MTKDDLKIINKKHDISVAVDLYRIISEVA